MTQEAVRPWERRFTLGQLMVRLALALIFVACAYPFVYVLILAVMPYDQFVRQPLHFLPAGFTLANFGRVFADQGLIHAFGVSVVKTLVGTTLNVLATVMAGWALSRAELRWGRALTSVFIVPLYVGGGLIPYFLVIRETGLLNTFWALIIPGLVSAFNLLVVRAYFQGFPQELVDAAVIDGASHLTILRRIVWPTSTPIIATMAVLYGVAQWNDYFWPSLLVPPNLFPATVALQNLVNGALQPSAMTSGGLEFFAPQSFIAAVATVLIVPVLVLYPFLQRYVIRGILLGSVKE